MLIATLDGVFVVTREPDTQSVVYRWHCASEEDARKLATVVGAPTWVKSGSPFFAGSVSLTAEQHKKAMDRLTIPTDGSPTRWTELTKDGHQYALLRDMVNAVCINSVSRN